MTGVGELMVLAAAVWILTAPDHGTLTASRGTAGALRAAGSAAARQVRADLDVGDLLLVGRAVVDDLAREGLPLNRRNLLAGVRARGRSCSTERAGALLKALRDSTGPLDERAV